MIVERIDESLQKRKEGDNENAAEQAVYNLLTECGFTIGHTGGGCTAWTLDFPNCEVMLSQDSGHIFAPEDMDYCGVSVGVYADCSPAWEDSTTEYADIPKLVCLALIKAMNYRPEEEVKMSGDLTAVDTLSDCYAQMLEHNFGGVGVMASADELLIAHGADMTEKQRAALSAFIVFWEALFDLETETYKKEGEK